MTDVNWADSGCRRRGRLCVRYGGYTRSYRRGYNRRYCSSPRWLEALASAYGMEHIAHMQYISLLGFCSACRSAVNKYMCFCRAVWLRIRIHSIYALPDIFQRRSVSYGSLCNMYRFHGAWHDAARYGGRMASGADGIHRILLVDNGLLLCHHSRHRLYKSPVCFRPQTTLTPHELIQTDYNTKGTR